MKSRELPAELLQFTLRVEEHQRPPLLGREKVTPCAKRMPLVVLVIRGPAAA
jgi:hypothetical protein